MKFKTLACIVATISSASAFANNGRAIAVSVEPNQPGAAAVDYLLVQLKGEAFRKMSQSHSLAKELVGDGKNRLSCQEATDWESPLTTNYVCSFFIAKNGTLTSHVEGNLVEKTTTRTSVVALSYNRNGDAFVALGGWELKAALSDIVSSRTPIHAVRSGSAPYFYIDKNGVIFLEKN